MNCQTFQDHLGDLLYADRGEPLEQGLAASLREHLQCCEGCAQEFRELQQVQASLDSVDEPAEAATSTSRTPVRFYASLARLQSGRNGWRAAACGAAALGLLVLMAGLWGPWSTRKRETSSVATERFIGSSTSRLDWEAELQRLTARLKDQEKLLGLLSAELQDVERRQTAMVLKLDERVTELDNGAEIQTLQLAALERDIAQVRHFLTRSNDVARVSVP